MITIKNPVVAFNFPTGFIISWGLNPTLENLSNYVFTILTSTDPSAQFVADGSVSNQLYYIHNVRTWDPSLRYYYRIQVTNTSTSETSTTPSFYLSAAPSGIALKLIQLEQQFLSSIIRHPGFYLIAKKFGKTCPRCFDQLKRREGDPNCPVCYGTGYDGGYFTPIPIFFQFLEPSYSSQVGLTTIGPIESEQFMAWMSNFPVATSHDVLIDRLSGIAYLVSAVKGTTFGGMLIRQSLTLQRLEPSSGIYAFPLPVLNTDPTNITSTNPVQGL